MIFYIILTGKTTSHWLFKFIINLLGPTYWQLHLINLQRNSLTEHCLTSVYFILQGKPVQMVVSPGYILSRSKSKTFMYIKTDQFFDEGLQQEAAEVINPERLVLCYIKTQLIKIIVMLYSLYLYL